MPTSRFFARMMLAVNAEYKCRGGAFRRVRKLWMALLWLVGNVGRKRKIDLPYLELMVTERCNLRCRHCSNLMQYFETPQHFDADLLVSDLQSLLSAVGKIYILKILGGEPLLHANLYKILRFACRCDQIKGVHIATNGGVMPDPLLLSAAAHDKVIVEVSPYGHVTPNRGKVLKALTFHGVRHQTFPLDSWNDFGDFQPRRRPADQNAAIFRACFKCVTLIDGEIFCCPRAGNGSRLGLVPSVDGERVPVRGHGATEIFSSLLNFANLKVISTCDFCNNPGEPLPIAEQIGRRDGV